MKKRIKPVLAMALTAIILMVVLSACGGSSKSISDGYYVPESSGNYEGIRFDNGKVTFYFAGISGEYAQSYDYTYRKDSKFGWVVEYNDITLQVEAVDDETLKFSNNIIYKKFTGQE